MHTHTRRRKLITLTRETLEAIHTRRRHHAPYLPAAAAMIPLDAVVAAWGSGWLQANKGRMVTRVVEHRTDSHRSPIHATRRDLRRTLGPFQFPLCPIFVSIPGDVATEVKGSESTSPASSC
ncbi:hypothetical protein Droror1_Dr00024847 [Drosera rotundifolia]